MINGTVLNYHATLPDEKKKILYIDTEQSPHHCKKVLKRILLLSGLPLNTQPETLEFLCLRKFAPSTRLSIIEEAIYQTEGLGLVIIDGVRDLAYDINSPAESTNLITKFMQWTDERQIHIHTVLHLNKGDDHTRGHLGTELNNKAETVLQVTKDDEDKDISSVMASYIREMDFEPFAFRINDNGLPELIEDYEPKQPSKRKGFNYNEVPESQHREVLENIFSKADKYTYANLVTALKKSYGEKGYVFGTNKTKDLKKFLSNKRMIIQNEDKLYYFNPDFYY